ncbi:MAG: DUF2905 domain-containing protein [Candidatus Binataceae bacterium]
MVSLAKLLVVVGIATVMIGLLLWGGSSLPIVNRLGRMPGDIYVSRGNWSIYVPVTSAVVISVALSFLLALLRR